MQCATQGEQLRNEREALMDVEATGEQMMDGPTPTHTLFDIHRVSELHRADISALAAGVAGAIQQEGFFTEDQCRLMMENLEKCEMGSYDLELFQILVPKLGPAAFDFYNDDGLDDRYWENADESAKQRGILLGGPDPLELAMDNISQMCDLPVEHATYKGYPLFAGMIREMTNGAGMHFDEVVREFPGALDEEPVSQLAFNCHISMPYAGGELEVYRRRWKPSDEPTRGSSYWYPEHLVKDEPYVSVTAGVGDAIFFDPGNYHLIRQRSGSGRRVTLSFFLGLTATGKLLVWS